MKLIQVILLIVATFFTIKSVSQDTIPENKNEKLYRNFLQNEGKWVIEIPVWIPGFRGEFAYGDVSLEGEDGNTPIPEHPIEKPKPWDIFKRVFRSDFYLNFVFMSRISFTTDKIYIQMDGFSGSVGESVTYRANNAELVKAKFSTNLYRIYGGYEVIDKWSESGKVRYQLYPYAGIRFHNIKVITDLLAIEGRASLNPLWFEPLIGIKNNLSLKRWSIVLNGDFGFFGPNNQISNMINFSSDFRISNLISLKAGWTQWNVKMNRNYLGEPLKLKINLSGPSTAVSFHF